MVKVPGGITVTIGEEGDSVVCGKGTTQDAGQKDNNDCEKRTTVTFRHLAVSMCVNSTMHHSRPKTYQ